MPVDQNTLDRGSINNTPQMPNVSPKKDDLVAYCPLCGRLEVKDGQIIHPAMDRARMELIKAGFKF
jgi:hypothetical protein